jgi:hypothetical protein
MLRVQRRSLQMGLMALAFSVPYAHAERAPFENPFLPDSGKLALTSGFSDVDGAGGGGLVPFALITGQGTDQSWGADAHYTFVPVRDFRLQSYGAAVGILDRVEVSYDAMRFAAIAAPIDGLHVEQHVFGIKVRLWGDAVYGQNSWLPQTSVGIEYRVNEGIGGAGDLTDPRQLGARSDSGIDYYFTATKVLLSQSILLNAGLRYTNANELGLLGFGGDRRSSKSVEFQASAAYLVTRTVAVGAEFRGRPRNLTVDDESGAYDMFVAWDLTRNLSLVGAYVRLGSILAPVTGNGRQQDGGYLSLQVGF